MNNASIHKDVFLSAYLPKPILADFTYRDIASTALTQFPNLQK
jgi:hypothetical protein